MQDIFYLQILNGNLYPSVIPVIVFVSLRSSNNSMLVYPKVFDTFPSY